MRNDMTRLGDLCEFRYGKSLPEQTRRAGEIPVYGSNGVVGMHDEGITDGQAIVIGRKGSIGAVHLTATTCWPIDTTYYVDRGATEVDLTWLSRAMSSMHLACLNKAAAVPGLNRSDAYDQKLFVPRYAEQRRIAAILDKADALRRKRKRALGLLDSLIRSIFFEMFGQIEQCRTISFGTALKESLRNGLSPSKAGRYAGKVLTLSAVTSGFFEPLAMKEAMFDHEPPISQRVVHGLFLVCRGNGNKSLVGKGVFSPISLPDTAFPDTIIAGRLDKSRFDSRYLQSVWNSSFIRSQIEKSARTTNGTFKVNQTNLEAIEIPAPNLAKQIEYGERLDTIDAERARYRGQLFLLDSLFASLQSRALSGQL